MLLAPVLVPVTVNAEGASPLAPFLLRPGDVTGFVPGKVRVFRTASAVRSAGGEKLAKSEVRRYESEGFVEAAMVRLHDQAELSAQGISSVLDFATPGGANAEMRAELEEDRHPQSTRIEGMPSYLIVRHFKVPGVPKAVGVAFVTNRAADRVGLKAGIAKGLFTEGDCLFTIGIFRPTSKNVIEPVAHGIQAVSGRPANPCL